MNADAEIDAEMDASARKLYGLGLLSGLEKESGYTDKGEEVVRTMLHEIDAVGLPRQMRGDNADNLRVLHEWLVAEGYDKESSLSILDWMVLLAAALPPFLRITQRLDFADRIVRRH